MAMLGEQIQAEADQERRVDHRMDVINALSVNWQTFRLVEEAIRSQKPIVIDHKLAQRYYRTEPGIVELLKPLQACGIVELLGEVAPYSYQIGRSNDLTNVLIDLIFQ